MILIISTETDISTSGVIKWILSSGIPEDKIIRIGEKDRIRVESIILERDEPEMILRIMPRDIMLKLNEVEAVWYRRGKLNIEWKPSGNVSLDKFSLTEIINLEEYINRYISKIPGRIGRYEENFLNKLICLETAAGVGLAIPRTLITGTADHPDTDLRLTKAVKDVIRYPVSENETLALGTILLEESFFEEMPEVFFPTLFQKYIEKEFELRIFFLYDKFYPMAIFSQNNEKTKIDFRNYDRELPNRTVPYKLPEELEEKLRSFKDKLGLTSGSIDMIYSTEREYVFLEVNPIGQFAQVSYPCNYYLEREIARVLTS